jgi:hypothetical protein
MLLIKETIRYDISKRSDYNILHRVVETLVRRAPYRTGPVEKERNPLQRGHVKDIGSTVGETVLSLSPILGGGKNKLGSASD